MSDDEAPRDEHGERLPVDEGKRKGGGSLADILGTCLVNAQALDERQKREAAALAEHRAACSAEECRTCGRTKCYACDAVFEGKGGMCQPCRARERHEQAKQRVFASVPARFRWALDADLETLASRVRLPKAKIAGALTWGRGLDLRPPSLVLSGVTGAGKTSLAVALFGVWFDVHRSESARFATCIDLGLAAQRHPLGHGVAPAIEHALEAPVLILDDLGAESPRDADVLRALLHDRHNAERPTWVTTGLDYEGLAKRYDGGVARRLFEESKHVEVKA